jgi:magnesium transporter
MGRNTKNISEKAGLKPGSLIYIGDSRVNDVEISYIHYTQDSITEKSIKDLNQIDFNDPDGIHWINIYGLNDIPIIEKLGKIFNIDHLFLEDILNTSKRPKVDEIDNIFFIILKMIYQCGEDNKIISEQISIVMSNNYILTFQEQPGDVFEPIRERIRIGKGPIRKKTPDYLCYAIIDAIVDNYFIVLENFEDRIEELEEELVESPDKGTLKQIYSIKSELIYLKKSVWPLREVLNNIYHGDYSLISKDLNMYIKDIYEHLIEVNDTIQLFLDTISNMLDIYLSSISNKMNEVMKILTIFSTIFIPLSFIVGVYGMNFNYIPELNFKYGYYVLWGIMISIAAGMLIIFKKRKWF